MTVISRMFVLLVLILSTQVFAEGLILASNQEDALKACEEQAAQSPKDSRDKMLTSCQCMVKNIDFSQAAALNEARKTQELQILYDEAAKSCP